MTPKTFASRLLETEWETPSGTWKTDPVSHTDTEGAEPKTGISDMQLARFMANPENKVTQEQAVALQRIRDRWNDMGEPQVDFLNGCIMVPVGAGVNPMWLGIEKDGYTHS